MHSGPARRRAVWTAMLACWLGPAVTVEAASQQIVKGELGAQVDEYLRRLAALGFCGAAIVAKDGEVLLSKGYGRADREKGVPVTPDTVFTIGSITKQFTGAAIMKLEMQGKLSVDDVISKHLEGVPTDKADITIHHLLTHTAGLPGGFGGDHDLGATREWVLGKAMNCKLLSKPGKRHRYSNVGYSLLGMIVERVSGQGYEEYLQEHLFKPAAMTRTGYMMPRFKSEELAVGYRGGERWGTVLERPMIEDGPCWNLRANGGIHSTIGDMYKWHLALEGDKILSAAAKEKYFAPHVDEGSGDSFYGYGWVNFTTRRGTRLLAHNGGNSIYSADFHRYVDEGVAIFVTSSVSEFFVDPISTSIARTVFGAPQSLPPKTARLDRTTLSRFAGVYRLSDDAQLTIAVADGHLAVAPEGQAAFSAVSSVRRASARRLEELNTRAAKLTERGAVGDFGPLHTALGSRLSQSEVAETASAEWSERQARLGKFKAAKVLGTAADRGSMVATVVRLDFEKGTEHVKYVWADGRLAGVLPMFGPLVLPFHPISTTDFISFKLRSPKHLTISFQAGETGSVTALVIKTPSRDLVASKVD